MGYIEAPIRTPSPRYTSGWYVFMRLRYAAFTSATVQSSTSASEIPNTSHGVSPGLVKSSNGGGRSDSEGEDEGDCGASSTDDAANV